MQNCKHELLQDLKSNALKCKLEHERVAVLCSEVAGLEPINLRPGIDVEWQDQ